MKEVNLLHNFGNGDTVYRMGIQYNNQMIQVFKDSCKIKESRCKKAQEKAKGPEVKIRN